MPIAFNPHPGHPVIDTLLRLHADLGGKLLENEAEAKRLQEDMKHVEAVIRMFDPAFNVRPIAIRRRRANPWFKRNAGFRHALDILRKADGPLTTREIATRMLQDTGLSKPSIKQVRNLTGAVNRSLARNVGKLVAGEGYPIRWTLSPECAAANSP